MYICVNRGQHALLQENWAILRDAFESHFGWKALEPEGTMYGMFRHNEDTDMRACELALKAGVGICPGSMFFGDTANPPKCCGWVRIHCGVSREKALAVARALTGVN